MQTRHMSELVMGHCRLNASRISLMWLNEWNDVTIRTNHIEHDFLSNIKWPEGCGFGKK